MKGRQSLGSRRLWGVKLVWAERREIWKAQPEDARDVGDIEYARVIHSASFRRLQGKTQILNLGDSDFYRTRLTHSLEVAQIAGVLAKQFAKEYEGQPPATYIPTRSLIQAIGCTHDLGHPPFGHGGEVALNYCMRGDGGFEGNGQTLRILSKLERFSKNHGANLTRRTLLGVLKYPVPYEMASNPSLKPQLNEHTTAIKIIDRDKSKPPKCYLSSEQDVVDWILEPLSEKDRQIFTSFATRLEKHYDPLHKSFDCSIMDLADDISFGVHDLEDSLALKLVSDSDFRKYVPEEKCAVFLDKLKEKYPAEFGNDVYERVVSAMFGDSGERKHFISRLVAHFLTHCKIEVRDEFEEPLVRYRAAMEDGPKAFLKALKDLVYSAVIRSPNVQHLEFKGQQMVVAVFEAIASEPSAFLPKDAQALLESHANPMRVICDYVSGMTDGYLLKTYERLFSPRMGSVFDKL
ncbi:anti-phage deoxyguanosine triphosphatase [Mesorhizobium sp. RIZ17]|uniref:anti-phage deoxyguanosine triphosphatase n=1 Tax=Mesorhizobium sp. RIZ17 TaxID=3132743 RepID=UPI003DA8F62F